MATSAPARARAMAVARPMPRLAPVTNAVLPIKLTWRHSLQEKGKTNVPGSLSGGQLQVSQIDQRAARRALRAEHEPMGPLGQLELANFHTAKVVPTAGAGDRAE